MYQRILAALDSSPDSDLAAGAALALAARSPGCTLIGCHVYAAQLHRTRFEQMEPGLPGEYQEEERLDYLRGAHESLITDGLKLISDAYLAPLAEAARKQGLTCQGFTPEGRNFVEVLRAIDLHAVDLVVLGAQGHGRVPESRLGSLTERVLLQAGNADVLIMRRPWQFKYAPIVVGIDGSADSYAALQRAIQIGQDTGAPVEAVAIYDPFFHTGVFGVIAGALPEEDQQRFDFPAQEQLHDAIIDQGLEKLYQEGLDRGVLMARQLGVAVKSQVLAGKVYPQLHHYAGLRNAGLIVTGRHGLHRADGCSIGSNSHNLARLAATNLLVAGPPQEPPDVPDLPRKLAAGAPVAWTEEAEARLKRIPFFARGMARRSIEDRAREQGIDVITGEFVGSISQGMGMGGRGR